MIYRITFLEIFLLLIQLLSLVILNLSFNIPILCVIAFFCHFHFSGISVSFVSTLWFILIANTLSSIVNVSNSAIPFHFSFPLYFRFKSNPKLEISDSLPRSFVLSFSLNSPLPSPFWSAPLPLSFSVRPAPKSPRK